MTYRNDGFVELYLPAILRVLAVLDNEGADVATAPELREELVADLNAASDNASHLLEPPEVSRARRLATAWCDERLASDPWSRRDEWIAHPLQSDWGEGRRAGETFFELVEELDPSRPGHAMVAALALRCLALGLDGCMGSSPEKLREMRVRLAERFGLNPPPAAFPPPVAPAGEGRADKRGKVFILVAVGLALLLLAGGWWFAGRHLDELLALRMHGVDVGVVQSEDGK